MSPWAGLRVLLELRAPAPKPTRAGTAAETQYRASVVERSGPADRQDRYRAEVHDASVHDSQRQQQKVDWDRALSGGGRRGNRPDAPDRPCFTRRKKAGCSKPRRNEFEGCRVGEAKKPRPVIDVPAHGNCVFHAIGVHARCGRSEVRSRLAVAATSVWASFFPWDSESELGGFIRDTLSGTRGMLRSPGSFIITVATESERGTGSGI